MHAKCWTNPMDPSSKITDAINEYQTWKASYLGLHPVPVSGREGELTVFATRQTWAQLQTLWCDPSLTSRPHRPPGKSWVILSDVLTLMRGFNREKTQTGSSGLANSQGRIKSLFQSSEAFHVMTVEHWSQLGALLSTESWRTHISCPQSWPLCPAECLKHRKALNKWVTLPSH